MAKVRMIDAFMDGKIFAKVTTKDGYKSLLAQIEAEDPDALDKIDEIYRQDFGKNLKNDGYYLSYYKRLHKLEAMCSEFFEHVYNSGNTSPYTFNV